MFEKSFITDCEGPLTLNDNAFEIAAKFIENGGELFKILSLYDDYLVDVVKKEGYKAGNTLKLILPFFVVENLKNSDIVLLPKLKPMEIKAQYGIPCFSKLQDDFIDRYQRGSRCKSIMVRINGKTFIGKDGKEHTSSYRLNKKARELLLNNKLHRISPKCCTYLKKKPAHDFEKETGLKAILGVRGNESFMRKSKYQTCLNKNGKFTPLWDMTDDIENEIYKRYNIEIPKVYQYVTRTGCMGCPYGSYSHDTEKELSLIGDSQRKFVCEYFKESYEVLGVDTNIQTTIFDFIGDETNE